MDQQRQQVALQTENSLDRTIFPKPSLVSTMFKAGMDMYGTYDKYSSMESDGSGGSGNQMITRIGKTNEFIEWNTPRQSLPWYKQIFT